LAKILETTQLAFIVEIDSEARDNNRLWGGRQAGPKTDFDGSLLEGTMGDSYFDLEWTLAIPIEIAKGHYGALPELGNMSEECFRQTIQPMVEKSTGSKVSIEFAYDRVTGISGFLPHGLQPYTLLAQTRSSLKRFSAFRYHIKQSLIYLKCKMQDIRRHGSFPTGYH